MTEPPPQAYIDLVKAAPSWITGPKSDRLILLDPGGRVVNDKNGQPISVPFSQPRIAPPPPAVSIPQSILPWW
jgi:hypothetical protein